MLSCGIQCLICKEGIKYLAYLCKVVSREPEVVNAGAKRAEEPAQALAVVVEDFLPGSCTVRVPPGFLDADGLPGYRVHGGGRLEEAVLHELAQVWRVRVGRLVSDRVGRGNEEAPVVRVDAEPNLSHDTELLVLVPEVEAVRCPHPGP